MSTRPPPWAQMRTAFRPGFLPFYFVITTAIFVTENCVEVTGIEGSSMSPTLSPNYETTKQQDYVLWKKHNPTRNLQRGDVVFFSAPHKPEGTAVKRVVGLPGDTVLLDPRRRPRDAQNGRANEAAEGWDSRQGRVQVPEGHVWVEGDNWRLTRDSNDYGPISKSLIKGKAWSILSPFKQLGTRPWDGYEVKTKVIKGDGLARSKIEDGIAIWEPCG